MQLTLFRSVVSFTSRTLLQSFHATIKQVLDDKVPSGLCFQTIFHSSSVNAYCSSNKTCRTCFPYLPFFSTITISFHGVRTPSFRFCFKETWSLLDIPLSLRLLHRSCYHIHVCTSSVDSRSELPFETLALLKFCSSLHISSVSILALSVVTSLWIVACFLRLQLLPWTAVQDFYTASA